jgi:RimJ/RimL family protein N-acetyltransferase
LFVLTTPRLLIRPWLPADRSGFEALTRDPEVMRYVHAGEPYTDLEIDEFLARQTRQNDELGVCMGALIERATETLVGVAGVQPLGTTGDLEIGWWLARDRWGRGYATEAGEAAMRHVLETLDRPRVVAIIDPGNEPSRRVVARLGMQYERRCTGADLGHRAPGIVVDLFSRHGAR